MTAEEKKMLDGVMYDPGDPELVALKLRTHNMDVDYNRLYEDDTEERERILHEMFLSFGEGSFMQGPIYIHYGSHTRIGTNCFFNFNTTIQDDTYVTIGNDCNFGTGLTIVTPCHPMIPEERRALKNDRGDLRGLCYARPVVIGSGCWFGANVTVCPGVTVGEGCVIGAGSVITRDIPARTFAAGVPCRVIRGITEKDSLGCHPELLGGCSVV